MIKRIRLATAKRGLGREEFAGGWREAVAAAASAPERVRPVRLTVSVSLPEVAAGQRHDGVALEWFGDREHLRRFESWLGTPPGRAVQRLRSEVIEFDASPVVVTTERVARGAEWLDRRWQEGGPKLKQLTLATRADGLTLPQFLQRWRGRAGHGRRADSRRVPRAGLGTESPAGRRRPRLGLRRDQRGLLRRRGQPARPHRLLRAGAGRRGWRPGPRELVPRGQRGPDQAAALDAAAFSVAAFSVAAGVGPGGRSRGGMGEDQGPFEMMNLI